jgi:hypothetical protein
MENNNDSSIYLNKPEDVPQINRGIELLLRNKKRRGTQKRPKSFRVTFGKVISLFNREIHFHFDSFIDIRKRKSREKDLC